jgi:hypothetical protein
MRAIGLTPREPALVCDGCGVERPVTGRGIACAAVWFLDGKAAPGWAMKRGELGRVEYCPKCRTKKP